jgi:4-hydroxy-2-oxoheptanedioate aldolase
MQTGINHFKARLRQRPQIGMFSSLGGGPLLELFAHCGFDWIMLDTEHSPFDLHEVVGQLQVLSNTTTSAIVRPPSHSRIAIKRLLDAGAQTLLIPDVRTADQALHIVASAHYPPVGERGVSGNSRASRYGLVADYLPRAAEQLCLLLQIESAVGMENLERIASTPGVDGIFVGPADLAASMGHLGDTTHPDVLRAIDNAFATLRRLGKPSGYLSLDEAELDRRAAEGIEVLGIATDTAIIAQGARQRVRRYQLNR